MTDMQTCASCGITSFDVKRTLVELPPPWRMVHDPNSNLPVEERFGREPRCQDRVACRQRVEAAT